jgi:hypothetical protein
MPVTQTTNPPNFDTVWAILQEVAESQKETDRIIKEVGKKQEETALQMKETDRRMEETALQMKETDKQMKETDKQMKETDRRLGKLSNRFGEIVEYMIAPNLREKFKELGLIFPKANLNSDIRDYENKIFFEIDVMLENGDKALLVEVKTTLSTEDVKDHIKRLEKMRVYSDLHGDKRTFLGAVAGVVMTPTVKEYALGHGFYVIEPSGETFNITPPQGKPKEW